MRTKIPYIMFTRNYTFFTLLFSLFILLNCTGPETLTFSDWDKNGDDKISDEEFVTLFTSMYYSDWDMDGSVNVNPDEFYENSFYVWDMNNDNYIIEREWRKGMEFYLEEYEDELKFEDVDADYDDMIDMDEYENAMKQTNMFLDVDVDEDEYVTESELAEAMFRLWDLDDSGFIEKGEYVAYKNFYLNVE